VHFVFGSLARCFLFTEQFDFWFYACMIRFYVVVIVLFRPSCIFYIFKIIFLLLCIFGFYSFLFAVLWWPVQWAFVAFLVT